MQFDLNLKGELSPGENLSAALSRIFSTAEPIDGSYPVSTGNVIENLRSRLESANAEITRLREEKAALLDTLRLAKDGLELGNKKPSKGKKEAPAPKEESIYEDVKAEDATAAEAASATAPTPDIKEDEKPITVEELRALSQPLLAKDKVFEGKTYFEYAKEKLSEIGVESIAKAPKEKFAELKTLLLNLRDILI